MLSFFKCPKCDEWLWKRSHRPTTKLRPTYDNGRPRFGVGDIEYTYPCGFKCSGDSLPEFR